jgi:hypothetical protein
MCLRDIPQYIQGQAGNVASAVAPTARTQHMHTHIKHKGMQEVEPHAYQAQKRTSRRTRCARCSPARKHASDVVCRHPVARRMACILDVRFTMKICLHAGETTQYSSSSQAVMPLFHTSLTGIASVTLCHQGRGCQARSHYKTCVPGT